MAKYENPSQIIRKDGKNCFVEVLSDSFSINRVRFNFCTYDLSAATGSRITSSISIFLPFDEFYRICHDMTVSCILLQTIKKNVDAAKASGTYPTPITLNMGGRSARSLAASGTPRPDGMSLSRQLKLIGGDRFPVLLQAECGPGEQNEKGLIVPRYKTPEQRVLIPFTYETIKELFLIVKAHVDAYIVSRYVAGAMVTTIQNQATGAHVNPPTPSQAQPTMPASRTPQPHTDTSAYNRGYMPSSNESNFESTINGSSSQSEIKDSDIDIYLSMMKP